MTTRTMPENPNGDLRTLLDFCAQRGLKSDDLDDLVYDAVANDALPDINAESNDDGQEGLICDAEANASDINNGGLEEQLSFLLHGSNVNEVIQALNGLSM